VDFLNSSEKTGLSDDDPGESKKIFIGI